MFEKAIEIIMAEPTELHYPAYFADLLRKADAPDTNAGKCSEIPNSSDTISRQDAIDALSEAGLINYAATGDGNGMIQAVNVIKGLPPAQPDIDKQKLVRIITVGIAATNTEDVYSCGMRNGLRWCRSLLDGNAPEFEDAISCGRCKYAEVADKGDAQDGYTCQFHRGSIWFSGSFCSWAERRTDG